jgi:hypothetical protein
VHAVLHPRGDAQVTGSRRDPASLDLCHRPGLLGRQNAFGSGDLGEPLLDLGVGEVPEVIRAEFVQS